MHSVIPVRPEECSTVVLVPEPVYTQGTVKAGVVPQTHTHKARLCCSKPHRAERWGREESHRQGVMTKRCYTSPSLLLHSPPLPPSFIHGHQGRTVVQMKHRSTPLPSTLHTHTYKHTHRLTNIRCCISLLAVTSLIQHTVHSDIINKSQGADSSLMAP